MTYVYELCSCKQLCKVQNYVEGFSAPISRPYCKSVKKQLGCI